MSFLCTVVMWRPLLLKFRYSLKTVPFLNVIVAFGWMNVICDAVYNDHEYLWDFPSCIWSPFHWLVQSFPIRPALESSQTSVDTQSIISQLRGWSTNWCKSQSRLKKKKCWRDWDWLDCSRGMLGVTHAIETKTKHKNTGHPWSNSIVTPSAFSQMWWCFVVFLHMELIWGTNKFLFQILTGYFLMLEFTPGLSCSVS